MADAQKPEAPGQIGLCDDCQHVRRLENRRGHVFYRCEKSKQDRRFLAYPPLPVEVCRGYARRSQNDSGDADDA